MRKKASSGKQNNRTQNGYLADRRTLILADYIIQNGATVRCAAKEFSISKSTVHKDVTSRLKELSPSKFELVARVLEQNKAERHLRGGEATKEKYLSQNNKTEKEKKICRTSV
ncbi:MAG: sporulation transcriptional regulator SpoIIID [Clostridia bacterium]|nr:sporulation transcriptional regulator SpoIIID [Clostridia bacterium]